MENMLSNTKKNIANRNLRVGYFGGSITEGAGASSVKKCWREMLTDHLKILLRDVKVEEINAAIGGTGTDLGIFRLKKDLLQYNPNLIFLEFAVNDNGKSREEIFINTDKILSDIWTSNSKCDVIIIITYNESLHDEIIKNGFGKVVETYKRIAEFYNIPVINVGEEIGKIVEKNEAKWSDYTIDGTHPNDRGYELYFNKISNEIASILDKSECRYINHSYKPIIEDGLKSTEMIDSWNAVGFTKCDESLCGRYPHMIVSENIGDELEFEFEGNIIGLYYMLDIHTGAIKYSIDGGEEKVLILWDKWTFEFPRAGSSLLCENLKDGIHSLRIKNIGDEKDCSRNKVKIGAFLTAKR